MPDRKPLKAPLPLADVIQDAFRMAMNPDIDPLERLKAGWSRWAGDRLAARSSPLKYQDGRLLIGVESSVWANEMEFQKEKILEGIRADLPKIAVRDLRYRIVTRPSVSI